MRPRKGGLASQLTTAIVTEAIGVANELEAEVENSKDLKIWKKPDVNSAFYKDLVLQSQINSSRVDIIDPLKPSRVDLLPVCRVDLTLYYIREQ
jgi:hypothetical protein